MKSMKSMKWGVGIDLGTTNSCVAIYQNGCAEIIANDQGILATPSWVAFTESDRLMGDAAKNQAAMNPYNTIFDAKRLIGRMMDDHSIVNHMKRLPFKVVAGIEGRKLHVQVEFKGETKTFSPEEISSMILTKMKETAEGFLGTTVNEVVISVPAYFNDSQRQATKDASMIAGFNTVRLISEPTAAALAYYDQNRNYHYCCDRPVLIYDLGGGTFDVSLVRLVSTGEKSFSVDVQAVAGDTLLGGEDFDNRLVSHCIQEFKRKHKKDPSDDARALRRIRTACERAKRNLSSATQTAIVVDSAFDGIDFETNITRAMFEMLCHDLFERTIHLVDLVLRDAKILKGEVYEIVLVGGSTRIPKIQSLLRDFFNGKELCKSINPDEAVACGAAVDAALLRDVVSDLDLLVNEVSAFSLGVEGTGGVMEIIRKRNTSAWRAPSRVFSTYEDNQTDVIMQVFEGERQMAEQNNLLGEFRLVGLPHAPRGVPRIKVSFSVGNNGILTVTAADESNKSRKITVTKMNSCLSGWSIESMRDNAMRLNEEDKRQRKKVDAKNSLESYVYSLLNMLHEKKKACKLEQSDETTLSGKIEEATAWLETIQNAEVEEYEAKQKELEGVAMRIMTRIPVREAFDITIADVD